MVRPRRKDPNAVGLGKKRMASIKDLSAYQSWVAHQRWKKVKKKPKEKCRPAEDSP